MKPRPRRVLFASSGCSVHDRRFLLNAVAGGFEVFFIRFDGKGSEGEIDNRPESVNRVDWIGDRWRLSQENFEVFCKHFDAVVSTLRPDVIHAGPLSSVASVAVQVEDIPVIAMSWAFDVLRDYIESSFGRQCVDLCMERATAFVADCSTVKERLEEFGSGQRPVVSLPWGVDLLEWAYVPPVQKSSNFRLLNLRSWESGYRVHELIEAFAENREFLGDSPVLVMAGGGSLEGELRLRASSLGLENEVVWLGRIGESEVRKELMACDVHVSTSPIDGASVSLLHAMAIGRPSVVCDIASNREWVTAEGNGWLFAPGNVSDLGRVLCEAARDFGTRRLFGARSRKVVEERANWDDNRLFVLDLYDHLIPR